MLNDWFLGRYALVRQALRYELAKGPDPFLICAGSEIVYWRLGRRQSRALLSERYEHAKVFSHVPAAIHLMLRGRLGVILERRELDHFRALAAQVRDARQGAEGPESAVLEASGDFLDRLLQARCVTPEEISSLASAVLGPMDELATIATRDSLRALDEAVREFSEDWDERMWARLLVVVCAGHAPRYRQSTKLYFQRLLEEPQREGAKGERQIVYAEGADSEEDAFRLAAEHRLNRELGAFFLKSSLALQEDLLGEKAEQALAELFAKPKGIPKPSATD